MDAGRNRVLHATLAVDLLSPAVESVVAACLIFPVLANVFWITKASSK
jgi:hypothetical protein